MGEHCPTCGSTVEVHHGLEGTSHYRPVEHDLRTDLRAAEARARTAEEALRLVEAACEDDGGHAEPQEPGVCSACDALRIARSALATIREGS